MRSDAANLTLAGRAVTDPQLASTASGDRVRFRVVSTERRFDEASGAWVNGDEFGVNVVCWGRLARGVMDLIRKGDPIIVAGRLVTRRVERDQSVDYYTDLKADVVAIDVARANGRVKRVPPNERIPEDAPGSGFGDHVEVETDADDLATEPIDLDRSLVATG